MKKIFSFMIMFCLMFSLVSAATPQGPMPVKGYVTSNGELVNGVNVEVTNERTGEVLDHYNVISLTTENGIYVFLANDFKQGFGPKTDYYQGDAINIKVGATETTEYIGHFPYIVPTLEVGNYVPPIVDDPEEEIETVVDSVSSSEDKSYVSVDAFYGDSIDLCVGNSKISKLLNEEIRFDGTNYDISEKVCTKGQVQTSLDNKDFGLNPYLYIEEISYSYIFEDLITLSDISEDETLSIVLLGKEVEISKASASEITLISGEEYNIEERSFVEVNGKKVSISIIGNGKVYLDVDGVFESLEEGDSEEVNGLDIRVNDIISNSDGFGIVNLRIGLDIERVIEDGDDYVDGDYLFEWVIDLDSSPQVIGVINQDEYKYLDDDTKPLAVGNKISLPEGYLDLQLNSVTSPELTKLEFRVRDNYLEVEGDFNYGTEEYNEVYVNSNGIYDRDYVLISDSIQIGDSDINLELGSVIIKDLEIELDLSDILHKGSSYALKDEDYLDYYGIIFKDPESAVEDKRNFKVYVPEERPEVTIKLGTNLTSTSTSTSCPKANVCAECKPEIVQNVCPKPVVCPEEKVCDTTDSEDGSLWGYIAGLLAALAGGFGGFFVKKKEAMGKRIGVKIYTKQDGSEGVYHKHPGIKGYHSPNTIHRDSNERHPKGELTPKYTKDETGIWNYGG